MTGGAHAILRALTRWVFHAFNEKELQAGIAAALDAAGIAYAREPVLTAKDRPDFLVGSTVIEVKVGGSRNELLRQVARYAALQTVGAIVVVTTRPGHCDLPAELRGKPVSTYWIGSSCL